LRIAKGAYVFITQAEIFRQNLKERMTQNRVTTSKLNPKKPKEFRVCADTIFVELETSLHFPFS
jgi:hypothetical protein